MKQNIFSYKNAVFYTHINGCVHECRFKKLLLAIKSLCYWNDKDANLGCGCPGLNIVRMDVSIAGHNGTFGMNDGVFDPNRIYRSIEDCIKDTKPIFYSSGKFLKLDVPLWNVNSCQIMLRGKITVKTATVAFLHIIGTVLQ